MQRFIWNDTETSKDLGWNCLAIKKDGEQCISFRKYGKFCKKHLEHYIRLELKIKPNEVQER